MTVPINKMRYTAPYTAIQTSFDELGIPAVKAVLDTWRAPYKDELKSGELHGKSFHCVRSGQHAVCTKADWVSNKKQALIHHNNGVVEARSTRFLLSTIIYHTKDEKIALVIQSLPNLEQVILPTGSCNGDIDISFILDDGTHYTVPYNY